LLPENPELTCIRSSYLDPRVSSAPLDPPPVSSNTPQQENAAPVSTTLTQIHNSFLDPGVSSAPPDPPPVSSTTPQQENAAPVSTTLTQIHNSFLDPGMSSAPPDPPPVSSLTATQIHSSFLGSGLSSVPPNPPQGSDTPLPTPASFLNPSVQSNPPGGNSAITTVGLLPPSSYVDPNVQSSLPPSLGQSGTATNLLPLSSVLNPSSPGSRGQGSTGTATGGTATRTAADQTVSGQIVPGQTAAGQTVGGHRSSNQGPITSVSLTESLRVFTSTDSTGGIHLSTSIPGIIGTITDSKGSLHTTTYSGELIASTYTDKNGVVHTSTFLAANAAITKGPNRVDRPVHALTTTTYFMASFLPTLLAIILRISVGLVYAATKMMEPFYSLADPAGALAIDFFNINYLSTNDMSDPFTALSRGHWLMLFTAVWYFGAGLITPFASEFLGIERFQNIEGASGPEMRVNLVVGRIIEGLLVFVGVMLIGYLIMERRHKSGIYSDPSSIASMACLLHNPEVIKDFKSVDPGASKKEIEDALADKVYRLDYYNHVDGTERYGVVSALEGPSQAEGVRGNQYASLQKHENRPNPPTKEQAKSRRKYHIRRVLRDILLGLVTAGLLVIVVWYYFNSDPNNSFEKFLDSQQFGPRFVFSVFGILLHSQWKRIERGIIVLLLSLPLTNQSLETCIIQSFRRLKRGTAPAKSSINLERTLSPFATLLASLPRGHVFCALTAFTSILAEMLIITLGAVPWNVGQVLLATKIACWLSSGILCIMLAVLVIVYIRPRGPPIPRTPNTIAAVFSYLCASRMLDDFADLATVDSEKREERVNDMGRTYCLDVMDDGQGTARWTIDYDYEAS
jgi:hypothetical protein